MSRVASQVLDYLARWRVLRGSFACFKIASPIYSISSKTHYPGLNTLFAMGSSIGLRFVWWVTGLSLCRLLLWLILSIVLDPTIKLTFVPEFNADDDSTSSHITKLKKELIDLVSGARREHSITQKWTFIDACEVSRLESQWSWGMIYSMCRSLICLLSPYPAARCWRWTSVWSREGARRISSWRCNI